jgi:hypothetical protein
MFFEVTDSSVTLNPLINKGLQRRLQIFWNFPYSFLLFFLYAHPYPYPIINFFFLFFFKKRKKRIYNICITCLKSKTYEVTDGSVTLL